jgi:crotonobetainyl-CoA:carnitine CoA-transferase CaiB-like acyl-CoA transferase
MSDMQYETGQLRGGGRVDRESAQSARTTEQALRSASISAFGDVGNAARIAGQAVITQEAQAGGAAAAHRDDQGGRSDSAASQGDSLAGDTTAIARSAP